MSIAAIIPSIVMLGEAYGLQIHAEIVARLPNRGHTNVGQIYSTLERLTRDGILEQARETADGLPLYRLTENGKTGAREWLHGGRFAPTTTWDDFVDVLFMAATHPDVDWALLESRIPRLSLDNVVQAHPVELTVGGIGGKSGESSFTGREQQLLINSTFVSACTTLMASVAQARANGSLYSRGLNHDRPKRGRRPATPAKPVESAV